jgi:hypothetical protein
MYTINGLPYINLDPYLDTESLENHYVDFCAAIGKNYSSMLMATHGKGCSLDTSFVDLSIIIEKLHKQIPDDIKPFIGAMSEQELRRFCSLYYDILPFNYNLMIRAFKDDTVTFNQKHLASRTKLMPAAKDFSFLFAWLHTNQIFSELGRIQLFLSEPHDKLQTLLSRHVHRDYPDGKSRKDQFILITIGRRKKLFLLDVLDGDREIPIDCEVSIFDNSNWHGVYESSSAVFSIRVDGIFSQSFLEKTNLLRHFDAGN